MNNDQTFVLVLVLAAVIVMVCLAFMWHADQDAEMGRDLRRAAGSDERARLAIEEVHVQQQLEERLQRELDQALTYKKVNKVTPIRQLRIVERGRPMHFEGPGAA